MDDHIVRGKTMTGRIWRLLMFELWHRNFLEKFVKPAGLFSLPVVADSRRKQCVVGRVWHPRRAGSWTRLRVPGE